MKLQERMAFPHLFVSPQRLQSLKCIYFATQFLCDSISFVFIEPLCDTNEAGAKHFITNFIFKRTKNISAPICAYSLQHPQKVLVLLVLNLRIEFGCPKGEAQFALPDMFNFPCISIRRKFGLVF